MKRYTGKTMQEALSKARCQMGEDVVILNSEYIQTGEERYAEVLATPYEATSSDAISKEMKAFSTLFSSSKLKGIEEKIDCLKESLDFIATRFSKENKSDGEWSLYQHLLNNEIEDIYAKKIINALKENHYDKDNSTLKEKMRYILNDFILVSGGIKIGERRPKVIALVGPTGVGKTTTIAKLAAYFTFTKKLSVALISLDNYRIGADEQLKTYGNIMRVPVETIQNSKSLPSIIERYQAHDIILIDTTGRSQYNQMQLCEIASCLNEIREIEIHLTLSLNTRYLDLKEIAERFKVINYSRVLFTKIDETKVTGALLNIPFREKVPVSYLTHGQNVPQDILEGDKEFLLDLLLNDLPEDAL